MIVKNKKKSSKNVGWNFRLKKLVRMKLWTKDNSEEIVKMRRRLAFIGMMRASAILLIIMNSLLPGTFAQVGNLLLVVFLLWIKAPFSTSSHPQVGDYLTAGPCIQDASCESILCICFIRHKGACLSSWFLTESFTNIWSMCTLSFNTLFIDCKLQYIHSKF